MQLLHVEDGVVAASFSVFTEGEERCVRLHSEAFHVVIVARTYLVGGQERLGLLPYATRWPRFEDVEGVPAVDSISIEYEVSVPSALPTPERKGSR